MADAVEYLKCRLQADPQCVISFSDVMKVTKIANKANFNRTIRKHPDFTEARDRLGLVEVAVEGSTYLNAFKRPFGPVPGATYIADV